MKKMAQSLAVICALFTLAGPALAKKKHCYTTWEGNVSTKHCDNGTVKVKKHLSVEQQIALMNAMNAANAANQKATQVQMPTLMPAPSTSVNCTSQRSGDTTYTHCN